MLLMNAVNAGSRDSLVTFDMARRVSRKSILSNFMEALRQSRRREARRVIATYAHLVADRDTIIDATSCDRTRRAARSKDKRMQ
jgi:hypothetical protein